VKNRLVTLLVAFTPLALGGCASQQGRASGALDRAIVATEITDSGEALEIPAEGITEVDVNSSVALHMDQEAIQGASPAPASQHAAALKLASELKQLTEALQAQLASIKASEALQGKPHGAAEMQAAGKLQLDAVEKVKAFVKSQGGDPKDLYSQAGYDQVVGYLNKIKDEHEQLLTQIDSRTWRLRASLRDSARAEPVHLANYDALSAGTIDIKNKLVPVVDDAVHDELKQAQAASAAAGDLKGFSKLLEADAGRRVQALEDYLVATLSDLSTSVEELGAVKSANVKATELIKTSKATLDALKGVENSCAPLLEALKNGDKSKPIPLIAKLSPLVSPCTAALSGLAKSADATKAAAEKLANVQELRDLVTQVEHAVVGVISEKLNLNALEGVVGLQNLAPPLQAAQWANDADFRDVALAALVDTRIELPTTPRKPGDYLTYQGLVRDRKEDTTLVEGPQRSLRVVSTGLNLNVSGALLFVQPTTRVDNEDSFRAAPALTAAFHYHCRRNSGQTGPTGACALWNGFDPGLGAHAATLTLGKVTTDAEGNRVASRVETPHVGVAAALQLFGDIAQAGAGYDFQSGRAYWFVGLGIQTLTKLGFNFGL
jgi:hypothetical protein